MHKSIRLALAAHLLLAGPALADEPLSPGRVIEAGPNAGDMMLGRYRLGNVQGGKLSFIGGSSVGLDLLAYVNRADVLVGNDVATGFRNAVNDARSKGARLVVPSVPGACYRIASTIDFSGVEIVGGGGCVSTSDAIDMFTTTFLPGNMHDMLLYHRGSSGRILNLAFDGNEIHHNKFISDVSTAKGPVLDFSTSNNHIRFNNFTNLRTGELTWRNIRNDPAKISINNQFFGNYLGGSASGGWIGDNDSAPRPEGTMVAFNESVTTGGPFLTIKSVLNARVFGNMMDQGNNTGDLRFEPGGYAGYGIDGVLVQGNYIAAPGGGGAPAIVSIPGVNGARAGGVSIVNNQIAYGSAGAQLAKGFSGQFSGNYMHGYSGPTCIYLSEGSMLQDIDFGSEGQCVGKSFINAAGNLLAGSFRSSKVGVYETTSGAAYLNVPHGLAGVPSKVQATPSIVGAGAANLQSVKVMVVAVDGQNVTLAVTPENIDKQGKVYIYVDSSL